MAGSQLRHQNQILSPEGHPETRVPNGRIAWSWRSVRSELESRRKARPKSSARGRAATAQQAKTKRHTTYPSLPSIFGRDEHAEVRLDKFLRAPQRLARGGRANDREVREPRGERQAPPSD